VSATTIAAVLRVHAGVLAGIAAIVALGAAGPAPAAQTETKCRGSLVVELGQADLRVRGIRTRAMSCSAGKRVIRRFFDKADSRPRCRREAEKDPPTPGCKVGRFHCWRGLATYCTRRSADVSWRDRRI
jgi:hypothetical protein